MRSIAWFSLSLAVSACQSAPRAEVQVPFSAAADARLFIGTPRPLLVTTPPPRAPTEEAPRCAASDVTVPGQWDWNGSWYWLPSFCADAQADYEYVPPVFADGAYIRGHFEKAASGSMADGIPSTSAPRAPR